jgi:hypothetical protein
MALTFLKAGLEEAFHNKAKMSLHAAAYKEYYY